MYVDAEQKQEEGSLHVPSPMCPFVAYVAYVACFSDHGLVLRSHALFVCLLVCVCVCSCEDRKKGHTADLLHHLPPGAKWDSAVKALVGVMLKSPRPINY